MIDMIWYDLDIDIYGTWFMIWYAMVVKVMTHVTWLCRLWMRWFDNHDWWYNINIVYDYIINIVVIIISILPLMLILDYIIYIIYILIWFDGWRIVAKYRGANVVGHQATRLPWHGAFCWDRFHASTFISSCGLRMWHNIKIMIRPSTYCFATCKIHVAIWKW